MGLLSGLWWASLVFAAAAFLWMGWLILARLRRERTDGQRAVDRQAVSLAFMGIMNGDEAAPARLAPFEHRARLLAETLLELLNLVRGAERERLIASLRGLNLDERFRARLFRGSTAGRMAAAEALEAFPGEATQGALEKLYMTSRDAELRVAAVRALIEIDAPPGIEALLVELETRDLTDSPLYRPVVRRVAADAPELALMAMEGNRFTPAATALLADALGAMGDYRALGPLMLTATSSQAVVRAASVRALGELGHPAAEEVITRAVGDGEWEVRSEACEAAGRIGSARLAPALVERLADETWWVRFRAAEALAALGPVGIEALKLASGAPSDVMRRSAAMALAERGIGA